MAKNSGGEAHKKNGIGTMNLILVIVGVALLIFTICMICLFTIYGSIPDTLCTCVFAALGGECGVMGWIKTNKDKNKEREWQLEDEKRQGTQHEEPDAGGRPMNGETGIEDDPESLPGDEPENAG